MHTIVVYSDCICVIMEQGGIFKKLDVDTIGLYIIEDTNIVHICQLILVDFVRYVNQCVDSHS